VVVFLGAAFLVVVRLVVRVVFLAVVARPVFFVVVRVFFLAAVFLVAFFFAAVFLVTFLVAFFAVVVRPVFLAAVFLVAFLALGLAVAFFFGVVFRALVLFTFLAAVFFLAFVVLVFLAVVFFLALALEFDEVFFARAVVVFVPVFLRGVVRFLVAVVMCSSPFVRQRGDAAWPHRENTTRRNRNRFIGMMTSAMCSSVAGRGTSPPPGCKRRSEGVFLYDRNTSVECL